MARSSFSAILMALAGACAAAPASAQFNPFEAIFGPFRPPADVPGRAPPSNRLPPGPPPSQQYPQQQQPYPQQYPPSARLPPGPPPGIQSQPLPPPPGAAAPQQGALTRPGQPRPPVPPPPSADVPPPPTPKIANPTAVFSGLDKITGRIITFDVAVNETVQFGALQVTPRVCYTRPPTETQSTDGFVEVDEVTLQGEVRRIFTGWMFASSPGLHAVEHPIYDVWLTDCKGGTTVIAETPPEGAAPPAPAPAPQRPAPRQQRRQAPAGEPPIPIIR